jgi:formylglycine-generating enzyme required for sulfatase activity
MHGNTWQWCEDPHDHDFYKQSPQQDPFATGNGRLVRGGSWINHAWYGRSAFRNSTTADPTEQAAEDKGFRIALSVEGVQAVTAGRAAIEQERAGNAALPDKE